MEGQYLSDVEFRWLMTEMKVDCIWYLPWVLCELGSVSDRSYRLETVSSPLLSFVMKYLLIRFHPIGRLDRLSSQQYHYVSVYSSVSSLTILIS